MNKNTYDTSSIKRVTRTLLDVSRCSRAEQRQIKKCTIKVCCTCKVVVFFLPVRLLAVCLFVCLFFLPFSLPSPLSIIRVYILFGQTIKIMES